MMHAMMEVEIAVHEDRNSQYDADPVGGGNVYALKMTHLESLNESFLAKKDLTSDS